MHSVCRDYHGAHTAFLLFVFAMSAWNGASFYFNYFAKCVPPDKESTFLDTEQCAGMHQASKELPQQTCLTSQAYCRHYFAGLGERSKSGSG